MKEARYLKHKYVASSMESAVASREVWILNHRGIFIHSQSPLTVVPEDISEDF